MDLEPVTAEYKKVKNTIQSERRRKRSIWQIKLRTDTYICNLQGWSKRKRGKIYDYSFRREKEEFVGSQDGFRLTNRLDQDAGN